MDLSVRPFAAVLVRAQLLLGAGCAAEPAPPPTAEAPVEPLPAPAPQAVEAVPEAAPAPPPAPIPELAEPVVAKKAIAKSVEKTAEKTVVVEDVIVNPDDAIHPDPFDQRILRVAPTCGPCCHGAPGCNRVLAPDLVEPVEPPKPPR